MVGLVIVSHSARLAEGVAELARGMGGPDLALAATGGLDLPDRPLGTDAMLVLRAIEEVYSDDGVLVLMDLGSAVLSAELAVDLLPPERREHVVLCEAPLVEGAVAAVVQARLGGSLTQVIADARNSLAAKALHLAGAEPAADGNGPVVETGATTFLTCELRLTVRNRHGLHARPAARFVQAAGGFTGIDIAVRNLTARRGPVNAKSIVSVLTLEVRQGDDILLTASGPDVQQAQAALDTLAALAGENLGEVP